MFSNLQLPGNHIEPAVDTPNASTYWFPRTTGQSHGTATLQSQIESEISVSEVHDELLRVVMHITSDSWLPSDSTYVC